MLSTDGGGIDASIKGCPALGDFDSVAARLYRAEWKPSAPMTGAGAEQRLLHRSNAISDEDRG